MIFPSCAASTAPQPSQREIKVLTDECGLEQDPASIADRVVCFCQHWVSHQPPADKISAHVPGRLQNFAEYKPRREVQLPVNHQVSILGAELTLGDFPANSRVEGAVAK